MSIFAQEYEKMMTNIGIILKKFKGYTGSEEHMKVLESCIEQGKNFYIQRGIIDKKMVDSHFGILREMIISRHKARKSVIYLEKCIAAEKEYILSSEIEEATIAGMLEVVKLYETAVLECGECTEEKWTEILKGVSNNSKNLLKKLDHNELSYGIHHDAIVTAFKVALSGIEERDSGKDK